VVPYEPRHDVTDLLFIFSLLTELLQEGFLIPEDLKTDQECGLAANNFLKQFPARAL